MVTYLIPRLPGLHPGDVPRVGGHDPACECWFLRPIDQVNCEARQIHEALTDEAD